MLLHGVKVYLLSPHWSRTVNLGLSSSVVRYAAMHKGQDSLSIALQSAKCATDGTQVVYIYDR